MDGARTGGGPGRLEGLEATMSKHDRGAFGELLAEAKSLGAHRIRWEVATFLDDDDETRWAVTVPGQALYASGRTGEEGLRKLVEALRKDPL